MKPFDLRLLRAASAVWGMLLGGMAWSLVQTIGIVLFAWGATASIVGLYSNPAAPNWPWLLAAVLGGAALRALAAWGSAATASRGAAKAKAQLRERGMQALQQGGPELLLGSSRSDTTLVLSRGLDALDDYFGSYLPQLLLTAIAMPLLLLTVLSQDLASGITIAIVIPIVPVFMVLIGLATRSVQNEQWQALSGLGRQFLDLVDGLSTIKIFRREHAQALAIEAAGEEYRSRTMKVLRLSFLSGFVLELAATLSVALVAVLIGTRLVNGQLALSVGLFVLLLTPDIFAPLRQVGASFHAAADGLGAADELFTLIDRADALAATRAQLAAPVPAAAATANHDGITLDSLSVWRGDQQVFADVSMRWQPGCIQAIVGPSGIGKSSLFAAVLGFARSTGTIVLDGEAAGRDGLRERVAWVPQRASLSAGSIAENVSIGDEQPDEALVRRALAQAAASDLDPAQQLGAGGSGLSGGQAQRVSLARAFYRLERHADINTLLLDEPSSALDGDTQQQLLGQLRQFADDGVCVVVVSHRDGLVTAADQVWPLGVSA